MDEVLSWLDPARLLGWAGDNPWLVTAIGVPVAAFVAWRLVKGGLGMRRAVINVAGVGLVIWGSLWFADWVQPSLTAEDLFVLPVVGPQPVKVAFVSQKTIEKTTTYTGTVHPYERVTVRARSSGFVEQVMGYPGDRIRSGHVIAKLDVAELEPRLEHAQAELEYLRAELQRDEGLFQRGAIAASALDLSRSKERVAAARLKLLQTEVGFATVKAPSGGWVSERMVDPGQYLQKGQPILAYDRLERVRVRFDVAEQDLALISPGTEAVLEFPQIPMTKAARSAWRDRLLSDYESPAIRTKVATVFPRLDGRSRLGVVEVLLENPDLIVRSNSYVVGHFTVDRVDDAWVVPERAVTPVPGGKTVIFLVPAFADEGEVEMREVKIGLRNGLEVEILEGLEENGFVVFVGNRSLTDGENVMVIERVGGL